jgi:aminopeptidase YwaD
MRSLLFVLSVFIFVQAQGQNEKRWIKYRIGILSGNSMHGRGYVNKGGDKAAAFIRRNFRESGVLAFDKDSSYYQPYTFSINTFPGRMYLKLNRKELEPGADYIVYGGSKPFEADKVKLKRIDLAEVKDSASWAEMKSGFEPGKAYFLKHADTITKYLKFGLRAFAKEFPNNLFIISVPGKMIWTANTETIPGTVIYAVDSVLPKRPKKASTVVDAKFVPEFKSQNVLGFVPGTEKPDSFIVFTAHYDHLGRMGQGTIFPGAHDNASGTSLILYLANYFAQHPQRYSTAFMLFSGEEAGLLGSKYYVKHPVFPLGNIRFVVNLDMTGDAKNGITVVNGDTRPKEFDLLQQINDEKAFLPKIDKRSQTQNSDHYSFSAEGVSAIFIYGNGTKPYYHDVFDKAKELSLENIDGLARMLIQFTEELSKGR